MGRIRPRHRFGAGVASLVACVLASHVAWGDAPAALDLGVFAPWDGESAPVATYDAVVPADDAPIALLPPTTGVAYEMTEPPARRFYLTSIVGGSFFVMTLDNTPQSSLTAGGAMGMALERSNGRLRLEVEGRYRDLIEQTYLGFNENFSPRDPNPVGVMQARTYGGWSALANVWRDFELTERIDVYGGGGIGGAGFMADLRRIDVTRPDPGVVRSLTGYAWQVGAGAIWNVNERVALDASYRIFSVGWTLTREDISYGFLRSEILLSLRIYEPFRGLVR